MRKAKTAVVAQTVETSMVSPSRSLTGDDVKQWLKNTAIFFAPVALIYLLFVQANLQDGVSVTDFVPNALVVGAMTLYVINTLIDLIRKFATQNTYTSSTTTVATGVVE